MYGRKCLLLMALIACGCSEKAATSTTPPAGQDGTGKAEPASPGYDTSHQPPQQPKGN